MTGRTLALEAHRHLTRLAPQVRPHPAAAELEADVRQWALVSGLCEPEGLPALTGRRVGHLVGWCLPGAPLPVARLVARYLAWVFVFDDTVAEDAELLLSHQESDLPGMLATGGAPPRPSAPAAALLAVRRDVVAAGGGRLLPELADGLRAYLAACAHEGPWRAGGPPPTLAGYLADRVHTSGGHPLHLHRLAPGLPPPGHPLPAAIPGLAELAFLIGGLANDLIGYAAEAERGDPVNVVTVLAHEYRLPPPAAFRAAMALHAAHLHRFDADRARLLADLRLSGPEHALVRAIGGWVAGSAAAVEPYLHRLATSGPRPRENTP